MSGHISLHRKINSNPLFKTDKILQAFFIDLLLKAEWRPHTRKSKRMDVHLLRGQTFESQRDLAKVWGLTYGKVRRMFLKLEKAGMITKRAIHPPGKIDQGGVVITLCNYDKYQSVKKRTDPPPQEKRQHSNNLLLRNNKRRVVDRVQPPPPPIPETASPLFFDSSSSSEKSEQVLALVQAFNESKTELLPPMDPKRLKEHVVKLAVTALSLEPCLDQWKKTFVRVGKSRWLTGQEPRKDGGLFDTGTVFEFALRKQRSILDGKYDSSLKAAQAAPKVPYLVGYLPGTTDAIYEYR